MVPLGTRSSKGAPLTRKMSSRPSLSASKSATPDPMVSIKYLCEPWGAWCRKWILAYSVISAKLPGNEPEEAADVVCGHAEVMERDSRASRLPQIGMLANLPLQIGRSLLLRVDLLRSFPFVSKTALMSVTQA